MNKRIEGRARAFRLHAVTAALALWGAAAVGKEIDAGNPDLKVRWDNTIRYNLGVRMEGQDSRILQGTTAAAYDESDAKFGKHDIVTNRIDLLSEIDLNYKGRLGGRVSAAGWYDRAYSDHSVTSPYRTATGGSIPGSYFGNQYNATVKRYVAGPSGEILDAFVWGNFNLGEVPVNVKLGRHTNYWGEGLLIGAHALSYSQAPADGQKAVSSPGIETKEVFLPLNQFSFKAQVTSDLTLAGQYFLEWKPTRAPNGGTYLMGADTLPNVDQQGVAPGVAALNVAARTPSQRGNWGLSARLNVAAIDSTVGAYYREFTDYNPETGIQYLTFTQLVPGNPLTTVPTSFRFDYPQGVKLYALSLARAVGPVSMGFELSLRKNAHLNSKTTYVPTDFSGANAGNIADTGARGDTWHAIVNGVYLLPKTALWETGSLVAELAFSHLQRITANANLYRGEGYAACVKAGTGTGGVAAAPGDRSDACSTKNFMQAAVVFAPQYLGVMPSWDLSLPVAVNWGVKGVAPTGSGGFENVVSWSIGANLTYQSRHEFSLRYSDISAPSKYNDASTAPIGAPAGSRLMGGGALGSTIGATDRGWLVFTYKTSF